MTTDIEKQFFESFGIEPKYESHSCDGWGRTVEIRYFKDKKDADKFGMVFDEAKYPQITDRILLEIIAKICWTYRCTANDFDLYEVSTAEGLKEAVLKHAIELSKNDDYIYSSVQALFEEG